MAAMDFVVEAVSFVRHVLQERIAHESDAHPIAAYVERSDLLVKLQYDIRSEGLCLADLIRPGAGVIAGAQEYKRLFLKGGKGDARRLLFQMPVSQNVFYRKPESGGHLIGRECLRNGKEKRLFRVEMMLVDRIRERRVVYHKIQRAVEELVDELRRVGFYEVDLYERILLVELRDDRR